MISKLNLTDFGKFRNAVFDLAPVSFIFGPNEAGKTTFFDGLFQALCKPSETKKAGKLLKDRYGANRKASLESTLENPISDEEFLNLFAIRAGDLRLELSQGSDWMEKLKSRLFHGGLDPAVLAEEFEKLSSDKRTFVHNKKLEELRAALVKSKGELDARRRERESLLNRERSLADLESSLAETRRLRMEADEKLRGLDRELAFEDKIAQRQKLSAQLGRLEEWSALEKSIRDLAPFSGVKREDWDKLSADVRNAEAKLQTERGKRELQADLVSKARAECRSLKDAQDAAGSRSRLAAALAEAARATLAQKENAGRPLQAGFAGACMAVILGSVGAFSMHGFAAVLAATFGVITAAACAWVGWRRWRFITRDRMEQALALWKDQWRLAQPGSGSITEITTVEGFLQAMESLSREKESLERQEQDALHRLHGLEETLERFDTALESIGNEEETARRAEKQWMKALGISGGEELLEKLSRLASLRGDLPKRKAEMEALLLESDPAAFNRELSRKLQVLDEEGIPPRGRDEAALQRLRRERQDLLAQRETQGNRERDLIGDSKGMAGEIHATLGKLAGEIVEWEDRTVRAESEIQAKELDKRAAALALEIFRSIGDGAGLMLSGLAKEMESMLDNILPDGRGVSLQGLADNQMQVRDAGGGSRTLENLSTGTKDAVVLAAKLALARKSREGAGILVLDEPFLSMDDARMGRSLNLLRDFHVRNGWQIIILSKEAHLREKVRQVFSNPLIIELAPAPVT